MSARTPAEAVAAAKDLGFPVVLKGLGRQLLHKTESRLVHLALHDAAAVEAAAKDIAKNAGDKLEGFLVQPMVAGKREFVAGLFRDEQYGPVVMFGLGGTLTEALADVSFRLSPLSRSDAEDMLSEIKSARLLGPFRGEAAVDRDILVATLMGISRAALEHPEVLEIDINPLLVTPDGRPVAVDALVVQGEPQAEKTFTPPVDPQIVGGLFYPRSVAFVGASGRMRKWGHTLLTNTISGGFPGEIYLVNPKGGTIAGRPVYKTLADIPGRVDLAVVTIPADQVAALIPQLEEKQVVNMLLIASGFAETGEDGAEKERNLVEMARAAGIYILGPNTMGICNPHINFYCTGSHVRPKRGATSLVAQSGNIGLQLLAFAELQGVGIRGFSGSGNEAMITIEDYLDSFYVDPLTNTVMLYIESVKNGRRFFEGARRLAREKPIVLLKGGQTRAGQKAASSHTGALASDSRVFDAVCKQAGIVKVERPMELLDLSAAFSSAAQGQACRHHDVGRWLGGSDCRPVRDLRIGGTGTERGTHCGRRQDSSVLLEPLQPHRSGGRERSLRTPDRHGGLDEMGRVRRGDPSGDHGSQASGIETGGLGAYCRPDLSAGFSGQGQPVFG
jgi:succinyl-CoA synthetase alpha subunit